MKNRSTLIYCVSLLSLVSAGSVCGQGGAPAFDLPPAAAVPADVTQQFVPAVGGEPIMPDPIEIVEPEFTPAWYYPSAWIGPGWDGSLELGLNGQEGNSISQSLRVGFDLSRETKRTNWDGSFIYNKASNNNIRTANNWLFSSNWDIKLSNPRWTAFTKLGVEFDDFKDFDVRVFMNGGLGYYFVKSDRTTLRGRFGAGASKEFGGLDEEWKPEAVFGVDFEHQLSDRQKLKIVHDYYPSWDDFSDYRMVTDASWELVIDAQSNLSLKLGALNRYDSTPNGAKSNDINYAVLLLWGF